MPKNQPELKLISLEDVAVEPVRWLWYPYVPLGKLSIIHGDPAEGKTTLALLLAGYLQPTEGQILLDGRPLPRKGICPVQLIYQHPEKAINPRWRLRQVLEESGQLREDMLGAFGIERAWLDRFPRELSGAHVV